MSTPYVLLVDDNEVNRYLAQFILESEGYEVAMAGDGVEALELMRRRRPDLVLMDLSMPRMDGFEATRRIKDDPLLADVPVLALSALAMPGERQRALDAGCAAHITKPIDPVEFTEQLRHWLPR